MKKKKKKEKSVQINNLKWHSEWRSASPFPATVSCSQTGSLYISIREFVSGETLWSRWLFFFFFFSVRGSVGYVYSRGVTTGRDRGVGIGVCRSWPPACNDHLMDVVSLRSDVCQGRAARAEWRHGEDVSVYCTEKKLHFAHSYDTIRNQEEFPNAAPCSWCAVRLFGGKTSHGFNLFVRVIEIVILKCVSVQYVQYAAQSKALSWRSICL